MEFHEKLQELRKSKGLTQEELAQVLYVSRTAISKWESGRGYPSIDSLKEISKYFSVTIDELLSGEKLLSIAEKENETNIRSICDWLLGVVDLFSFLLIVLPLYPHTINGYIYSVNLFSYEQTASFNRWIYWGLFVTLIVAGGVKIIFTKVNVESNHKKYHKIVTDLSMVLSIGSVLFLALTKEPYATTVAFMLLVVKGILILKHAKMK